MRKIPPNINDTQPDWSSKKSTVSATEDTLRHLAFDNAVQANIISTVSNGKIIMANHAACKLLGYSRKELLSKSRYSIFDINESNFKKMLKQRTAEGHSIALVTVINKRGKHLPCEITSAVFNDEDGIENSITTISDMRQSILAQKNIDAEKEIIVADNIVLAQTKQKEIDTKKEKIVADNIVLAQTKQKSIDIKKDKIVADNIVWAKSVQKKIDTQREKIVADNIVLAKSKQKNIDTKKEKIVANNIVLAEEKSNTRLAENNEWIKYIAETSYDVMWDWDIVSGEIYVGDSVEEVFGYAVQNNTVRFADFSNCLLLEEKDTVEKKLLRTLASRTKSWNDTYKLKRYDGTIASTISRASIVRNEDGKAIRLIGATQDVSRLEELEKKLEEQITIHEEDSEKFFLAAKLSFDVIWDWNLVTDEVFIGEGFEELFGYAIRNNIGSMTTDWRNHLHPDDKEAIDIELYNFILSSKTHWEHAYRVMRADGSIAKVFGRASIFRHADGKAYRMIGAIQDLSRQHELEDELDFEIRNKKILRTEYEENFKLIFNSSSDILYDIDLIANEVILSDAYEKEFGYRITNNTTSIEEWFSHIHQEDKEALTEDYNRMLRSAETEWQYSFRFLRADGTIADVLTRGIVLRDADGKAYRRIGFMQDMSKQKVLEERLEQEIKLKEMQIAEATEDAKETERSDIGKELHDNINQLLGASKMYVEMAKRGGENSEMYLSRSTEYTLKAIQEIRYLTRGMTTDNIKNIGLCEAIENLSKDTMEINPVKISWAMESFMEHSVNDKFKLNVFRIVQEQLNNILKHSKATEVTISLSQIKKPVLLTVSDNGIGFDTGKKQRGIGIINIKSRAAAYNGTADFVSKPGQGCILTVSFPVTGALNK